ncbi:hypothetical protein DENSPDRAFT_129869 [Dentipellis sp. KUC8613]|nr:hypothetical protein DENSPDRAFT_129869 [Dentipellis sp. KUC8613]
MWFTTACLSRPAPMFPLSACTLYPPTSTSMLSQIFLIISIRHSCPAVQPYPRNVWGIWSDGPSSPNLHAQQNALPSDYGKTATRNLLLRPMQRWCTRCERRLRVVEYRVRRARGLCRSNHQSSVLSERDGRSWRHTRNDQRSSTSGHDGLVRDVESTVFVDMGHLQYILRFSPFIHPPPRALKLLRLP